MTFHNNLTPVPAGSPLIVYQRLAEDGKLFFYDDHIVVMSIHESPFPDRPGYFALVLNRDTKTVTGNLYKFLGPAFLTVPGHPGVLTDFEASRIAYLRQDWCIAMVPARDMHPAVQDRLDEIEELLGTNMPSIAHI